MTRSPPSVFLLSLMMIFWRCLDVSVTDDYYEFFAPDYELHLTPEVMDNANSKANIDTIRTELLQQLGDLQGAPSVAMQEVPPLFQRAPSAAASAASADGAGGATDEEPVERRAHGSELYDNVD